jgi:hypothetical protein
MSAAGGGRQSFHAVIHPAIAGVARWRLIADPSRAAAQAG